VREQSELREMDENFLITRVNYVDREWS